MQVKNKQWKLNRSRYTLREHISVDWPFTKLRPDPQPRHDEAEPMPGTLMSSRATAVTKINHAEQAPPNRKQLNDASSCPLGFFDHDAAVRRCPLPDGMSR